MAQSNSNVQEEDQSLTLDEGMKILDQLAAELENSQWEFGDTLRRMRPTAAQRTKIAERYGLSPQTLWAWERTAGMIRERVQGVPFGIYKELARIPDEETRQEVFGERPSHEWTILSMKSAVDDWLRQNGSARGLPMKAKSGSRARFGDTNVKCSMTLKTSGIEVVLESSRPIDRMHPTVSGYPDGKTISMIFPWQTE